MRLQRLVLCLAVLAGLFSLTAAAQNRYIVRIAPTGNIDDVVNRCKLDLVGPLDGQNRGIFLLTSPKKVNSTEKVKHVKHELKELQDDAEVADAEIDAPTAIAESPSSLNQSSVAILDSMPTPTAAGYFGNSVLGLYLDQPATGIIRLPDAQTTFGTTGAGVVAVIDTGVDPNHVALQGVLVPGFDFVNNIPGSGSEMIDLDPANLQVLQNSDPNATSKSVQARVNQSSVAILDQSSVAILDTNKLPAAFGHGTMVAGIVHLVAPTAQIMPLKVFKGDGTANLSDILKAVYYAADHGARVLNMSFSLLTPSLELSNAINYANDKSAIMAASTGNTGTNKVAHPAAIDKVIGVASTTNADTRSTFSSFGIGTFVAAPGEQIITLYPGNNYAVASGTSFSAPMVAGTAALVVQVNPIAEYSDASQAISHAKHLTPDLGAGRLDVFQAMQFAVQHQED